MDKYSSRPSLQIRTVAENVSRFASVMLLAVSRALSVHLRPRIVSDCSCPQAWVSVMPKDTDRPVRLGLCHMIHDTCTIFTLCLVVALSLLVPYLQYHHNIFIVFECMSAGAPLPIVISLLIVGVLLLEQRPDALALRSSHD
jgi:hypothetical protein